MNIAEFLKARLGEDEEFADRQGEKYAAMGHLIAGPDCYLHSLLEFTIKRVLRDVEAKRRILAMHETGMTMPWLDNPMESVAGVTLRILAAVYNDHPDYDQEWV